MGRTRATMPLDIVAEIRRRGRVKKRQTDTPLPDLPVSSSSHDEQQRVGRRSHKNERPKQREEDEPDCKHNRKRRRRAVTPQPSSLPVPLLPPSSASQHAPQAIPSAPCVSSPVISHCRKRCPQRNQDSTRASDATSQGQLCPQQPPLRFPSLPNPWAQREIRRRMQAQQEQIDQPEKSRQEPRRPRRSVPAASRYQRRLSNRRKHRNDECGDHYTNGDSDSNSDSDRDDPNGRSKTWRARQSPRQQHLRSRSVAPPSLKEPRDVAASVGASTATHTSAAIHSIPQLYCILFGWPLAALAYEQYAKVQSKYGLIKSTFQQYATATEDRERRLQQPLSKPVQCRINPTSQQYPLRISTPPHPLTTPHKPSVASASKSTHEQNQSLPVDGDTALHAITNAENSESQIVTPDFRPLRPIFPPVPRTVSPEDEYPDDAETQTQTQTLGMVPWISTLQSTLINEFVIPDQPRNTRRHSTVIYKTPTAPLDNLAKCNPVAVSHQKRTVKMLRRNLLPSINSVNNNANANATKSRSVRANHEDDNNHAVECDDPSVCTLNSDVTKLKSNTSNDADEANGGGDGDAGDGAANGVATSPPTNGTPEFITTDEVDNCAMSRTTSQTVGNVCKVQHQPSQAKASDSVSLHQEDGHGAVPPSCEVANPKRDNAREGADSNTSDDGGGSKSNDSKAETTPATRRFIQRMLQPAKESKEVSNSDGWICNQNARDFVNAPKATYRQSKLQCVVATPQTKRRANATPKKPTIINPYKSNRSTNTPTKRSTSAKFAKPAPAQVKHNPKKQPKMPMRMDGKSHSALRETRSPRGKPSMLSLCMPVPLPSPQPHPESSPQPKSHPDPDPAFKFNEVVRERAERKKMPTFECRECADFYRALMEGKGAKAFGKDKDFQYHCRHRAQFSPPSTPVDFWELSFVDERDK